MLRLEDYICHFKKISSMKKITTLLSALLFFTIAGITQNSGSVILNKGQKYLIENKFTALSTQEMMGQSMESKAEVFTSNNIEVKDIKDNNYHLTNTFTKVTAVMSAMGQDITFDSDKKEDMNGEMGSSMKDIINQPKNVLVDKNGKIIYSKKDTTKLDTTSKESAGGMMSMMMEQLFGNPEETGFGLSEAFMIVPSNAKQGFSWSDSSSKAGIKKSTTYTIKEIKGSEAIVTISGNLNADTKTEMQGMEISSKSSGKITGEEIVDLKTGLIKLRTTTLESSGNMEAMGQEIPMTTRLTSVSTVKNL